MNWLFVFQACSLLLQFALIAEIKQMSINVIIL